MRVTRRGGGCMSMVEPPTPTPPEGGAAEQHALLATKLHVPRTHRGLVPRPRLVGRLTQGLEGELTLVCAPAGFGKTALLADWTRRSGRAVAWLSLDAGDNDPARFWRHAAAALGGVRDGVDAQLAPLLRPPPRSFESVVTALVNELAAVPGELVLVLDDYHLIESEAVHESLAFLLEHLPAGLRLVVASRADPPLPLGRLRARGQLVELRAAELRFTSGEAAALLREAVGPDLPEDAVAALTARTEGWAAGLQLAALSLRGRSDPAGFVAAFSGSHRYVLDYLAEEVLERQPEQLRGFLLETSVLDRLCGALCDAVTGRADGQRLLETIERANLFLIPLDEVRGWYRYHQLFADLLRVRLGQERPERLPVLHRAAAGWCEERGLVDDAIRHALAAGDATWAARLVERHIGPMLGHGETTRWLAALPAELVRSRPRLCVVQANQATMTGQADELERWLDDAERALAAGGADEPTETDAQPASAGWAAGWPADVPGTVAVLRADLARLRGDADRTIQLAGQALTRLSGGEHVLRFIANWNLARARWLNGELGEAERALAVLVATARAAGGPYLTLVTSWDLGRVQRAQGRLHAALRTYEQGLAIGAEVGSPSLPALGIAHVGVAAVLCEQDDLGAALDHVTEGVARCRQLAGTRLLAEGLAVLARIRHALGDQAGALAAIGEAERVGPSLDVVDLFSPAAAERARLLLAHGQVTEAAGWAAARGLGADDEPSYLHEREHLLLARLLLAQGELERARRLLERMHAAAAAQGRTGSLVELGALQAHALAACGEQAGALAALAEALALAWPEGYVRVFVDEGAPLAVLLDQLVASQQGGRVAPAPGVPPQYLHRLRAGFEPRADRATPAATRPDAPAVAVTPGLAEPLTDRELQVLALVAAGTPNQQIAEELVVALETVKKHVSHILGKLGAANRTQAVARAREQGLLP
jgi:LuxR family maltose regulon positive regulatory protein